MPTKEKSTMAKAIEIVLMLLLAGVTTAGFAAAYWDLREGGALLLQLHHGVMPSGELFQSVAEYTAVAWVLSGLAVGLWGVRPLAAGMSWLPLGVGWLRLLEVGPNLEETFLEAETWNHILITGLSFAVGLYVWTIARTSVPKKAVDLERKTAGEREASAKSEEHRGIDRYVVIVALAALAYIAGFTTVCALRYYAHKPGMFDLGMYDQLHWAMWRHDWFYTTVYELPWGVSLRQYDYNYNAEHFMPIMLFTSLLYLIWAHPTMLFLAESTLLGATAIPLYYLARRVTGSRVVGLIFGLAWLLNPGVQQANINMYHPDTHAAFFLVSAFWAFEARRPWLFGGTLLLAMMAKEDVSLLVAASGIFLLVARLNWRWGLAMIGAGLVYYFGIAKPIITAASHGAGIRQLDRFSLILPEGAEPKSIFEMALIVLQNPGPMFELLMDESRLRNFVKTLTPVAWLAILYPPTWPMLAPAYGAHIFSNWGVQGYLITYHIIAPTQLIFIGSIYAAAWLAGRPGLFLSWRRSPDLAISAVEADSPKKPEAADESAGRIKHPAVVPPSPTTRARLHGIAGAVAAAGLASFYFFGHVPPGDRWDKGDLMRLDRADAADRLMAEIPPEARVAAQDEFGAYLTHRPYIYHLPDLPEDTEYVAFDLGGKSYGLPWQWKLELMRETLTSGEWGVVHFNEEFGMFLLKRDAPTEENDRVLTYLDEKTS